MHKIYMYKRMTCSYGSVHTVKFILSLVKLNQICIVTTLFRWIFKNQRKANGNFSLQSKFGTIRQDSKYIFL